ncbi:Ribulokinase [Aquimixticola soesokkakensis]|uniref:Ribulokinase n=1 Tax=Aquimixticola soesokkakensis TaxID=1519096 RepID=A0A1Y5RS68_9RHOB|nr:FGGY-family carbohydrate kinase [Aquimixticola soesokkakensis]SLN21304.1 Ribulokinase [Aquimixticola soesokkakensis]
MRFLAAVDVGTTSARAGIFDVSGALLARAVSPIRLWMQDGQQAEHASQDIWRAVCTAMQAALNDSGVAPETVLGLAFDATCSLVLRDQNDAPLALGPDGRDTIAWFDHRAATEARTLTQANHPLVRSSGGAISPELQIPKLAWLRNARPDLWAQLGGAYDLADFLAYRATGRPARSASVLAAKWGWDAQTGWQDGWFRDAGLADMRHRAGLKSDVVALGAPIARLSAQAATDLGLTAHCMVAAGAVDAFAGALATLGPHKTRGLALIGGTSTCVMGLSRTPLASQGLWGPFYGTVLPDHYACEGGQSSSGALLDHVIRLYGNCEPSPDLHTALAREINDCLAQYGQDWGNEINVLPDFNGRRSPNPDPMARGLITGLSLESGRGSLRKIYWRTAVALALGLREIVSGMGKTGFDVSRLHLAGGHARSPLLVQTYADALATPLDVAAAQDTMLLGSAMLAATGAGLFDDLAAASVGMQQPHFSVAPEPAGVAARSRDFAVFCTLRQFQATLTRPEPERI